MIKKNVLLTALAIAGFAVTTSAQTVPNYVPSNGLVGWWPFNGNAVDESVNTNDGTVNGATLTADRFGSANSAYSFDGVNDFLTINNSFDLPNRSYNFWFNPSSILPINGTMLVSDHPGLVNGVTQARVIKLNNIDSVQIATGQLVGFYLGANTSNNNWQMLTYVRTPIDVKMYVNGILISTAQSGLYKSSDGNINTILGCDRNYLNDWYNGKLDDIGIWNRALTPSEITGLYNGNLCFQTITVTDTLLINTNLTGFNPVTYQNTIKIWPNPTNDHITIDNGNLANLTGHQIKISNALGQQVFQSAITQQQFYVDMSTWGGNGIYFVNLINAQGVTIETRKIVLQ